MQLNIYPIFFLPGINFLISLSSYRSGETENLTAHPKDVHINIPGLSSPQEPSVKCTFLPYTRTKGLFSTWQETFGH